MIARRVVLGSTVLAFFASAVTYPWLPARVPIHFDIAGRADGFASRPVGALMLPITLVVIALLLWARPRRGIDAAAALTAGFLLVLHVLVLRAALGDGTLGNGMWLATGVFFVALGLVLPRVRPNRLVGVRTPWALRSPEIWARTQRVGGASMLAGGLLVLLSAADSGPAGIALRALAIFGAALVPVVYSFWLSRTIEPS